MNPDSLRDFMEDCSSKYDHLGKYKQGFCNK